MLRLNPFCLAGFPAALSLPIILLACSSDDGHGPVIGAPNTPIVISEGGSAPSGGSGNPNGGSAGTDTGGVTSVAGTNTTVGGGGTPAFDPFGGGGDNPFGTGSPGFGAVGGSDPFGTSGTSNTSGTTSF